MSESRSATPFRPVAVADAVTRYETAPLADIHEELRQVGIDPAPTIAAVKKLVEDSLVKTNRAGAASTAVASRRVVDRPAPFFVSAVSDDSEWNHDH